MNSKVMKCVLFFVGLAIGSVVTKQYLQKKYENIVREEIDSVKELRLDKKNPRTKEIDSEMYSHIWKCSENSETDMEEYEKLIETNKYTNNSEKMINEKETNVSPYVIPPEEFGEFEEYEKCTLLYYSDHVLAYEDGASMDDVDAIIGEGSLECFGEYENDSVFVRNDRLKCDYEILLEPTAFYSDD